MRVDDVRISPNLVPVKINVMVWVELSTMNGSQYKVLTRSDFVLFIPRWAMCKRQIYVKLVKIIVAVILRNEAPQTT